MKRIISVLLSCIFAAAVFAAGKGDAGKSRTGGELFVYSVINDEETRLLTELFTERTGIRVTYLRAATGELVNRVIAERKSPQADVLLGGPSSLHIAAAEKGALSPYRSPVSASFPAYTKDPAGVWNGFCVLTLGIGINTDRFEKKFPGKKLPAVWDDLTDPDFKDEIVMTDPASSSTAYLFVQNQLQRLGYDAGWEYLLKLSPLVGQFPSSGGAPPKLVGTGEYAIGIAYVHALAKYKAQGFPVQIIAPPQSAGEVDAVSVIKNGPNEANARAFIDFLLSEEAQTLFASLSYTTPVNPAVASVPGAVSIDDVDLLPYDAELAGRQRDQVLDRWQKTVK
ncbi:ABC transporter substrate-binding protein [Treponema brennaborense]|uniref:Extracellular solute-binding protein family 1 n=1 Tax=Treponema brennaborense (strain DSM 12168 / CIP 105900 / DD5/3) TaxID=906968 RepID=F4LM52_TREBD|nr:ABC transporter substrate-binding protein [Treponema brennaborense]AEE16731.1 extracellular solute-binding protein family 1 [Treponema brennaborense DSM 12168]